MRSIYDISEQDEQEIGLCWCGEGYQGHNRDHDMADEITDKIYLTIRDSWGRNDTLEQTSMRIWRIVENSLLRVVDNIEAAVRR